MTDKIHWEAFIPHKDTGFSIRQDDLPAFSAWRDSLFNEGAVEVETQETSIEIDWNEHLDDAPSKRTCATKRSKALS